jgi:hypothetical protein
MPPIPRIERRTGKGTGLPGHSSDHQTALVNSSTEVFQHVILAGDITF